MKTICTLLGTLMAGSLIAQINTNSLPPIPAPVSSPAAESAPAQEPTTTVNTPAATPSPAPVKHKKHHVMKKKAVAKPEVAESPIALTPGPAEIKASGLVVRGQPGLKGEEITHLSKGDTVTVLEQINLAHHAADEPAQWAKISYPTNGHVWVNAKFVDSNGTVTTKKLNLRAGPGENYSVVGEVQQGAQLTVEGTKGNWTKVAPPENAYAFVAAKYLTQEAAAPTPPPEPAPTPTPVPEQQPIVSTPPPTMAPPTPPTPTVRIIQHEGLVTSVGSLIAPTEYKLVDHKTGLDIDYLYPTSPDQDLHVLVNDEVIVTGEEGIDPRWPNTPVMAIQSIQVVGTNVVKHLDTTIPRLRH